MTYLRAKTFDRIVMDRIADEVAEQQRKLDERRAMMIRNQIGELLGG